MDTVPLTEDGPEPADLAAEIDEDLLAIRTDPHLYDDLTPLEREVIVERFGLDGHQPHRLAELQTGLHLPRREVRHLLTQGLGKLRSHLG